MLGCVIGIVVAVFAGGFGGYQYGGYVERKAYAALEQAKSLAQGVVKKL